MKTYDELTPAGKEFSDRFREHWGADHDEFEEYLRTGYAPLSVRFRWWRRRMRRALRWK